MNTSERPFRVCHLGCQAHKGTEPSEHQSIFQQGWQNEQGAVHSPQQGSFLPPIPFSQDSDSSRQVLHPQKRLCTGLQLPLQRGAISITEIPLDPHLQIGFLLAKGSQNSICCQMVTLHSSSALHRAQGVLIDPQNPL